MRPHLNALLESVECFKKNRKETKRRYWVGDIFARRVWLHANENNNIEYWIDMELIGTSAHTGEMENTIQRHSSHALYLIGFVCTCARTDAWVCALDCVHLWMCGLSACPPELVRVYLITERRQRLRAEGVSRIASYFSSAVEGRISIFLPITK